MTVSTTDADGRPANPNAALTFYWPQLGRQILIRGAAAPAGAAAGAADFLARPAGSRAEALIGRQSEILDDPADSTSPSNRLRRESPPTPA
ncbi:hypothetical protein [Nonomuraea sp. NPDC049784]|uniref:hypothetical protein n=1 Tax=Nonomuraea sp. NPDC049784 TaxID=3154361 RepID=UPI0033D15A5D